MTVVAPEQVPFARTLGPEIGAFLRSRHEKEGMMMRGVEKQNSTTVTCGLRGVFKDCNMTREEFLRLAHRR